MNPTAASLSILPFARDFALAFTSIFVALDIIGVLPMYISVTRGKGQAEVAKIINDSMLVALIVALVFVFIGQKTFQFVGISVADFKIAGGIILLLVSLSDLVGSHEAATRTSGNTGIVPLAVPLITGPGVLTTVIWEVARFGYGVTLAALLSNYLLSWIILRRSEPITKLIGNDGTVVISKIAALLLTSISVAMIRSGVFEAIKDFRFTSSG